MITRSGLFHLWKRQVFLRNRHTDFDGMFSIFHRTGIYLIGCAGEIVYVGQTWHLDERPIQSLGNIYHRVDDTSLPWSIAFAPCPVDEMNERESSAIRAYAPRFNTSLPNLGKSQGRLPEIVVSGAVFQDQVGPCGAFTADNLAGQMQLASANPNPPWARKRTRAKSRRLEPRHSIEPRLEVKWTKEDSDSLVQSYGVPVDGELRFPINLCDDGCVITKDGEIIGSWSMDENEHPSFTPEGGSEPMLFDAGVGLLCLSIQDWLEGLVIPED